MRKILTLLGAICIAGSSASAVVSCGENDANNNKKTDQGGFNPWDFSTWGEKQKTIFANYYLLPARVFWIKEAIAEVDITVPAGTNPDTTNKDTITAIKNSLQKANPTLTSGDLKTITLFGTTLTPGAAVFVRADINVGAAEDFKGLNVTLAETNQQQNSNFKITTNNNTGKWDIWDSGSDSYEDDAVNAAGDLVVGDVWKDLSKLGGDYVDYDQNKNLIPDDSNTSLATYLKDGIYLYLEAQNPYNNKFTIIFIKGDIT